MKRMLRVILYTLILFGLTLPAAAAPKTDPGMIGKWGTGSHVSYEFKADGTITYEGAATYEYEANEGIWRYWLEADPKSAISAEYKLSEDKKSIQINMKQGKKLRKFVRIK
jgi:hypothetical protein